MIFVTVGSQKFQFNRLLVELDELLEESIIKEEVFAQVGYSDYEPKNYQYKKFLNRDEFKEMIEKSSLVITHGGTGAIINAVKKGKKVIAVARLQRFGEHVDDHQLQIIEKFNKMGIIKSVDKMEKLSNIINQMGEINLRKYVSNSNAIIESIKYVIDSI